METIDIATQGIWVELVVGFNLLLALSVGALALGLWRWRQQLRSLSITLQLAAERDHLQRSGLNFSQNLSFSTPQADYTLMLGRAKIAATRLTIARWQMRSRQVQQLLRGLQILIRLVR